jgi:hypothetical protein
MADFDTTLGGTIGEIQAIELRSVQPTVRTQSISGRQQVRSFSSQFYTARIVMPQLTQADVRRVMAFLVKQQGGFNTFTIAPHNLTQKSGTQSTSVNVGSASAGATSINLDTGTNLFKMGDMIKFSGHSKAYMITEDQGGTNTINFEPPLVSAVDGASESVKSGTEFEMTVRLAGDVNTYTMGNDGFGQIEFDIVEAI